MSMNEAAAYTTHVKTAGIPEERANIVKEFEWATTELDKTVSELQQRLAPLLTPSYDDGLGDIEPMPAVSPARSQLHNLQGQTGRIRGILDRLEV